MKEQTLWRHYQFITNEALKAVKNDDWPQLNCLLEQRTNLQSEIEKNPQVFINTEEGRLFIADLLKLDNQLFTEMKRKNNTAHNRQTMINRYVPSNLPSYFDKRG